MKKIHTLWPVLMASSTLAVPAGEVAEDSFLNHLTFSSRVGLNVSARFGPRTTPDGGSYNFLDGYVLMDSTGDYSPPPANPGDPYLPRITQYWGYDNSTRQRDAAPVVDGFPTVLMTRSASAEDFLSRSSDEPLYGGELSFTRELGSHGRWRYGLEIAASFMNFCMKDNGFSGNGERFAFPYYVGTSPPDSPTASGQPYQGRFSFEQQAGVVISDTPSGPPITVPLSIADSRKFDADIWGFRLGPYLDFPLGKHFNVNFVGGLAIAQVDASASWTQTLTIDGVTDPTLSGRGDGSDTLLGYYVGANISWHLSERWDLTAGVQFQDVGKFQKDVGDRQVELDLSESVYVTVGITFKF